MRAPRRFVLMAVLLTGAVGLSACESFDLDKLDVFGLSEKRKLPGERKPLFPEGVPGVTQGIPPDLVKGNQPPPDQNLAATTPAAAPAPQPAAEPAPPKRKPKPRVVRTPASEPTKVTVQPSPPPTQQSAPQSGQSQTGGGTATAPRPSNTPQQNQGVNSPWPSSNAQTTAPWPDAPAPGTFSKQ